MNRPSSFNERSEESIKALAQRFDVEIVFKLSLASKSLQALTCLEGCINLVDLDLSNNTLAKIEGLERLAELRRLNLSSNRITRLEGLAECRKLDTLKLQGNQVSLDGLNLPLLAQLPVLRALYLQNIDRSLQNPACKKPGYRTAVLSALAALSNLDGVRSPHSIDYFGIAEEADVRAAQPPLPAQVPLPEVDPWFQENATSNLSAITVDPEFQTKAEKLTRGIDDCHTLAEVLKEELAKFQRQLSTGAEQGS